VSEELGGRTCQIPTQTAHLRQRCSYRIILLFHCPLIFLHLVMQPGILQAACSRGSSHDHVGTQAMNSACTRTDKGQSYSTRIAHKANSHSDCSMQISVTSPSVPVVSLPNLHNYPGAFDAEHNIHHQIVPRHDLDRKSAFPFSSSSPVAQPPVKFAADVPGASHTVASCAHSQQHRHEKLTLTARESQSLKSNISAAKHAREVSDEATKWGEEWPSKLTGVILNCGGREQCVRMGAHIYSYMYM